MPPDLSSPIPYFGSKHRAADLVWGLLGDPNRFFDPFCGSLGVLWQRPPYEGKRRRARAEFVNDLDPFLANLWRAIQKDPWSVAKHADRSPNEADLDANRRWLYEQRETGWAELVRDDPEYFDAEIAGRWAWGVSWQLGAFLASPGRNMPNFDHAQGVAALKRRDQLLEVMKALQARLAHVRVSCGGWERALSGCLLRAKDVGVFLDPPYKGFEKLYPEASKVAEGVEAWAREHGEDTNLRIVLAGYAGDYHLPGWRTFGWKSIGRGKNRTRETLWASPGCLELPAEMRGRAEKPATCASAVARETTRKKTGKGRN